MYSRKTFSTVLIVSFLTVACGGSSDNPVEDSATSGQSGVEIQVSGTATVSSGLIADSDTNNPDARFATNDTNTTAQIAANPGIVIGYLSASGHGPAGSRFASVGDRFDAFRVSLAKDQQVSVQIADWAANNPSSVDFDLFLYDQNLDLVQSTEGVAALESLTVNVSNDYYVVLQAISGASNYALRIGAGQSSSSVASQSMSRLFDFSDNEALIVHKSEQSSRKAQTKASDTDTVSTPPPSRRASLLQLPSTANASARSRVAATDAWSGKAISADMQAKTETIAKIKRLHSDASVQFAEPNYTLQHLAIPNDPLYPFQWHYPKINLPAAWDITEGAADGNPVIVAVVDSGVIANHPDLSGQLVAGYDFISDVNSARDGNGIDSDPTDAGDNLSPGFSSWHGTHVTGTVVARSNNNIGVAGVAPLARVMPLRALGVGGARLYDLDQAIRFAAGLDNDSGTLPTRRADIINLSLGGPGRSDAFLATLQAARANGVIVVAAAGNDSINQPMYPASYPGVISVNATTSEDQLAYYSNFGPSIDISAPGGDSRVDVNNDGLGDGVTSTHYDGQNSTYKQLQGTSMAAPHVAGVIALMKAANPTLSPAQVDELILSGSMSRDLGPAGRDDQFGHGLIDAYKSVLAAQTLIGDTSETARLLASRNRIDFGRQLNQIPLRLESSGGEITDIQTVSAADWLIIGPASAVDNGLNYNISVSRAGLQAGIHTTAITITSSAATVVIPVTVDASTNTLTSDASEVYFLLIDTDNQIIAQDQARAVQARYSYNFSTGTPGTYYVVAGSDMDNDGFICGLGESCGGWPLIDDLQAIDLNSSISDLNFSLGARISLSSQNALADNSTQGYPVDKTRTTQVQP